MKYNYCGIILAKQHSERLPNKNFLKIKEVKETKSTITGKPIELSSCDLVRNTLCFSGVETFLFIEKPVTFINHGHYHRPPAASLDNEPLFSALKWAYKSLPKRYDAIINIMANAPLFTSEDVKKAIQKFEELGVEELRSFDSNGKESGLMIVKEKYLLEKHEVSTYQGGIILDNIEIHTQEDFDRCKELLS